LPSTRVLCSCERVKTKRVDLISDALPFGRFWYDGPNAASNAIGYASQYSRSHDAVIRVYDDAGNVIETHTPASQSVVSVRLDGFGFTQRQFALVEGLDEAFS
jgi:hypothetical protein